MITHHAFAGNPIISDKRRNLSELDLSEAESAGTLRVLPVLEGKPLISSVLSNEGGQAWKLAWQNFGVCHNALLASQQAVNAFLAEQKSPDEGEKRISVDFSHGILSHNRLVYLGDKDGVTLCTLDVSPYPIAAGSADKIAQDSAWMQGLSKVWELPSPDARVGFVDLRLLMTGTDCSDKFALEELSIAGHARAMLDWHNQSRFCGRCGKTTVLKEAGRRRQCINELCKKKLYPRLDPVVIMLVIDKEKDCVVLGRQSRFVPRMWSCLAGFIEPGESLEEAVRRETQEEVGIEVGEIIYHSSQPWPVGPSSMSCQLMIGFFAFAKTFDIRVDTKELEEAKWYRREDVLKALTFNEYKIQQQASALKVHQACAGEERRRTMSIEARVDAGELATMFVPGPHAIAHHLISTWARNGHKGLLNKV
ncbi:hypothetical protein KP509_31G047600 [Ceratopteris richardii]|uniref:NAD(+) diphosphatase n=1 Tax=Ceratopteris richardii TaxID=49495 RepID=A0A8T2QXQ9_CERRI|nr:hypothetical protein KP509_31G047600 [Ceratopteris richardii]KAH7288870.1 hypothetical protein KP509_31G047600 [Ceratopteris richardii]